MATVRPKSPRPVIGKAEKEESIWDKLGTLGRKKRIKEGMYNHVLKLLFVVNRDDIISKYGYVIKHWWAEPPTVITFVCF